VTFRGQADRGEMDRLLRAQRASIEQLESIAVPALEPRPGPRDVAGDGRDDGAGAWIDTVDAGHLRPGPVVDHEDVGSLGANDVGRRQWARPRQPAVIGSDAGEGRRRALGPEGDDGGAVDHVERADRGRGEAQAPADGAAACVEGGEALARAAGDDDEVVGGPGGERHVEPADVDRPPLVRCGTDAQATPGDVGRHVTGVPHGDCGASSDDGERRHHGDDDDVAAARRSGGLRVGDRARVSRSPHGVRIVPVHRADRCAALVRSTAARNPGG
jgi:hypothetical protein